MDIVREALELVNLGEIQISDSDYTYWLGVLAGLELGSDLGPSKCSIDEICPNFKALHEQVQSIHNK